LILRVDSANPSSEYIRRPASPNSTIRIVRIVGRATSVTPAVVFAVKPAWATAFPATTIAAAPKLRARRDTRGGAGPRVADWRRCRADVAAGAAVGLVRGKVRANTTAARKTRGARTAFPRVTVRGRCRADVAARATVIGIGTQKRAGPVAVDSARDAAVNAKSGNARDNLIGRRRGTLPAAASAVVDVVVESGAMTAATRLARGAANVAPAGSADAVGVAVAPLTGLETLRLLRLIAAFAEGFAGVGASGPGGFQPQGAQYRSGENGPQPPQRFAARHRLGQRLGEFIEQMVHDGSLSLQKKPDGDGQ